MSELEAFLESMGGHGEEGAFTLDYRAAFERLRRYQLGSTYSTLDCLVMSAVAAGACNARFVQNKRGQIYTFTHDGVVPDKEELHHLFAHILGGNESLRYLAIALNCSLLEGDSGVSTILSPHGKFEYRASGVNVGEETTDGFRAIMSGFFDDSVFRALSKKARFAPLALYYEDKLLNNSTAEGDHPMAACLKLYNPGPAGDHFAVDVDYGRGRRWTRLSSRAQEGEPISAACTELTDSEKVLYCDAVVSMTENPKLESVIQFFRHGVEIREEPFPRRAGLVVLLGSEGLQLDLTSHQVVRNQAYDELLDWVDLQAEELEQLLRKAYPTMDTVMRLKAARSRY